MREPVIIEIGAIPSADLRGNSKAHHFAKQHARKPWIKSGMEHANFSLGIGWYMVPKIRLTFEWHHSRQIDLDNLAIGMKPWVDGLVRASLVENDGPDHVTYGEHRFVLDKETKTVITIEEA